MSRLRAKLSQLRARAPEDVPATLRWLAGALGSDRVRLAGVSVLRVAAVLVGVASAAVSQRVLDAAAASTESLWPGALLVMLVRVASLGLGSFVSWVTTVLQERMGNRLRSTLYEHLLAARWEDLAGRHSERLLTCLTSDVSQIAGGLTGTGVGLLAMMVQAAASFALLCHYDASLAAFVMVLTPIALLVSAVVALRLRTVQRQVQQAEELWRERAQESLSHVEVVKAFGLERSERERLEALLARHERLLRRRARLSVLGNLIMGAAFAVAYLYAFLHGVVGFRDGSVTYGTFVAFLTLVGQIQSSLASLGGMLPRAASVLASAERVREASELPRERGGCAARASLLTSPSGEGGGGEKGASSRTTSERYPTGAFGLGVRCRGIAFSYSGADGEGKRVTSLDGFSLDVLPGEVVAVMGPSGAGKTTLVRLLLGLVGPDEGTMELVCAGRPLVPADARPLVGYVPQGNTLLSGTVRENLLAGLGKASDADLWAALEAAAAAEFVRTLQGGLDAALGERAHGISEGQAQRISIARALVRRPRLLLLDEATSALDERTELRVLEAVRSLSSRPTCVVVTHRSAAARLCDRVVDLGAGSRL